MLLIITYANDLHADAVCAWLDAWSFSYLRFHPNELATRYAYSYSSERSHSVLRDRVANRSYKLSEITAVWSRRALTPTLHPDCDPEDKAYYEAELLSICDSIYFEIRGAQWVNSKQVVMFANDKIRQLEIAKSVGFRIPPTMVTNDPCEAHEFYSRLNGSCITKPFRQQLLAEQRRPLTHKLDQNLGLDGFEPVKVVPTLIQAFVDKAYDLRVTVIGAEVIACKIHSQEHARTKVDFRGGDIDQLDHEIVALDEPIVEAIREYMRVTALESAEFDFAVAYDGTHFFLECNPNGQWLWIEILCRFDIAKIMAKFLIDKCNRRGEQDGGGQPLPAPLSAESSVVTCLTPVSASPPAGSGATP